MIIASSNYSLYRLKIISFKRKMNKMKNENLLEKNLSISVCSYLSIYLSVFITVFSSLSLSLCLTLLCSYLSQSLHYLSIYLSIYLTWSKKFVLCCVFNSLIVIKKIPNFVCAEVASKNMKFLSSIQDTFVFWIYLHGNYKALFVYILVLEILHLNSTPQRQASRILQWM